MSSENGTGLAGSDAGGNANANAGSEGTPPADNGQNGGENTPPNTPPAGENTPPNGEAGAWYGNIEDSELKGWVENKGFKDPIAALTSMKNQEKLIGEKRFSIPDDTTTEEGKKALDDIYKSLGKPEKAEDYQLAVPEGGSKEFAGAAAAKFHELGLSTDQARAITDWYNEQAAGTMEGEQANFDAQQAENNEALKKEWGRNYATELEIANRVNREFDISTEAIESILNGNEAELTRVLNRIGKGMVEDKYQNGDGERQFSQTQEGALAEIKEKETDKAFMAKYMGGDKAAKKIMNELYKRAYPQ